MGKQSQAIYCETILSIFLLLIEILFLHILLGFDFAFSCSVFKDLTDMLIAKIDQISLLQDIPVDLVKQLIESVKTDQNAFMVTTKLSSLPKEILCNVDCEIWNDFLRKACSGNLQIASQIQGIMVNLGIPVDSAVALQLICCFHAAQFLKEALEVVETVNPEELASADINDDVYECLTNIMAQPLTDNIDSCCKIVMIMIKIGKMPPNEKLREIMNILKGLHRYQEIYDLIYKVRQDFHIFSFR